MEYMVRYGLEIDGEEKRIDAFTESVVDAVRRYHNHWHTIQDAYTNNRERITSDFWFVEVYDMWGDTEFLVASMRLNRNGKSVKMKDFLSNNRRHRDFKKHWYLYTEGCSYV